LADFSAGFTANGDRRCKTSRTPHIIAPEDSGLNSAFKEVIAVVKDELCSSLMPHYRFGGFNRIYLQGILPNAGTRDCRENDLNRFVSFHDSIREFRIANHEKRSYGGHP